MTKGRRTKIVPVPSASSEEERPISTTSSGAPAALDITPTDEAAESLANVLSEVGEDAGESKVQVWRVNKDSRDKSYVTTYPPTEFSLERLREDCGGGVFNVRVYVPQVDADGARNGKMQLAACPYIKLEGAPKVPKAPEPPVAAPASSMSELAALLAAQRERDEKLFAILAARPPEKSLADQLKDVLAVKQLMEGTQPKTTDPLAEFERFISLQDKLRLLAPGGDSGSSEVWGPALRQGLGLLAQFINKQGNGSVPGAPALPAAVAPDEGKATPADPAPASVISQPSVNEEEEAMRLVYVGYVKMLLGKAKRNENVEPLAEEIYSMLADAEMGWLFDSDQWLETLASYDKDVKIYTGWFTRLREALKGVHERESQND